MEISNQREELEQFFSGLSVINFIYLLELTEILW